MGNCLDSMQETQSQHGFSDLTNNEKSSESNAIQHHVGIQPEPDSSNLTIIKPIVIGLYNYCARTNEDVSFVKGDRMTILDKSDTDWWYVEHITTKQQGYVPHNYIAREGSLESHEWFMRINRTDSDRLLLNPSNPSGTFLVTGSAIMEGKHALAVKFSDPDKGETVKRYKIRSLDDGSFCISMKITFTTLEQLVNHYKVSQDGLCCVLTKPCPAVLPILKDLSKATKDCWEIPRESLTFHEKLGAGQFGEVWRGIWNGTIKVALKTVKPGTISPKAFRTEAAIMKKCHHKNLVLLYAVCSLEEPIYIITELMCNGSLQNYLRQNVGTFVIPQLIDIGAQVASGMSYLESENCIHGNLAARNVLVGENNLVKIADFGMARLIEDEVYDGLSAFHVAPILALTPIHRAIIEAKFLIKWTAPEAVLMWKFTIKSDVWSFGILCVEIITCGQVPYSGMAHGGLFDKIDRGYRHPQPKDCPEELYELMKKCWDKDAQNRPTFEYLHSVLDELFLCEEKLYYGMCPN